MTPHPNQNNNNNNKCYFRFMGRNSHRPGSKCSKKKRSLRAKAALAIRKRWKKSSAGSAAQPAANKITGSRIMDMTNLSSDIVKVSEHSATCNGICRMKQEVRKCGLASVFLIQCDKCEQKFYLQSQGRI